MTRILWEQAHPIEGKDLLLGEPEVFIMQMNRAFGAFPCELGKDQLERLEGMAATWMAPVANPYDTLIRAIKRLGSVKVWANYDSAIDRNENLSRAE